MTQRVRWLHPCEGIFLEQLMSVLDQMGSENIQWLHSYVTEDKIYCVYKAQNKELLKEHAAKGGFPANSISEISTMISPETAK